MSKRLLKPKEISCRIQQINEKGLALLLYISSRAGQNILDEIYGALNWQRHHKKIDGDLYCTISVWDKEKGQWVEKEDVGTESFTEKEKGRASDSFKRACVNFGIGRELYSAPFIWVPASQVEMKQKNGKFTTNDKFFVKFIAYNDASEIDSLEIVNQKKEMVYKLYPPRLIDGIKLDLIKKEIARTGVEVKNILDMCNIKELKNMDINDFQITYNKLLATPSK